MRPERRPNPERSPDSLEARLRALPQPPVPADLEARLLATIAAEMPIPQSLPLTPSPWGRQSRGRRHKAVWVGVVGAIAAACLLAFLGWLRRDGKPQDPSPEKIEVAHQDTPTAPDPSPSIAALLKARRDLEKAETATFTWPLPEAAPIGVSTSIPSDLFD